MFGNFKVRMVEQVKEDETIMVKRVIFRPAKKKNNKIL